MPNTCATSKKSCFHCSDWPSSPGWPAVVGTLEGLIRSRRGDVDVCEWAEACLLGEIEAAVPGDASAAAALLGVTEPTMRRRKAELRHF